MVIEDPPTTPEHADDAAGPVRTRMYRKGVLESEGFPLAYVSD
jgi:hypothetical protein